MAHVTPRQIRHFLELDERGRGLRAEFDAFIRTVTGGGLVREDDDIRTVQAKAWWDRQIAKAIAAKTPDIQFGSFEAYLETIPEIPEHLREDDPRLPFLTLVEVRGGLTARCRLAGLRYAEFGYNDDTLVPFDDRHASGPAPFWARHDDGRKNRNRRPPDCRAECTGDLLAGIADVGVAAFILHPGRIVEESVHVADLPGSVLRGDRGYCAYLEVWDDEPKLSASGDTFARPVCGTLVFRR